MSSYARIIVGVAAVCLMIAWPSTAWTQPQPISDADFNTAFANLDSNSFRTRQSATTSFQSWILAMRLTSAQVGTLRLAISSSASSLELSTRCGNVVAYYQQIENLGNDIIANTEVVANPANVPNGGRANYQLDNSVYATGNLQSQTFQTLSQQSQEVLQSLEDGVDTGLYTRIQVLLNTVQSINNNPAQLQDLGLQKGDLDGFITNITNALNGVQPLVIQMSSNTNGSAQAAPVYSAVAATGGSVNVGTTLGLSVTPPAVAGNLQELAISNYSDAYQQPSPGYHFVGSVFNLVGDGTLDLTGSTLSVSVPLGPSDLLTTPIDPTQPVYLAHLADGNMDILSSTSDPTASALSGFYVPPSFSTGEDQLGEFALVQLPEPSSVVLMLALAPCALLLRRRCQPKACG
ncbi:MAG: PEP-CTERM sorting domain-containing protein [Thermoguttaceae bacterium]